MQYVFDKFHGKWLFVSHINSLLKNNQIYEGVYIYSFKIELLVTINNIIVYKSISPH